MAVKPHIPRFWSLRRKFSARSRGYMRNSGRLRSCNDLRKPNFGRRFDLPTNLSLIINSSFQQDKDSRQESSSGERIFLLKARFSTTLSPMKPLYHFFKITRSILWTSTSGTGGHGCRNTRKMYQTSRSLWSICEIDEQRRNEFVDQIGVGFQTNRLEDLFSRDLDIIDICTPSALHFSQAAALQAGFHVVLESRMLVRFRNGWTWKSRTTIRQTPLSNLSIPIWPWDSKASSFDCERVQLAHRWQLLRHTGCVEKHITVRDVA